MSGGRRGSGRGGSNFKKGDPASVPESSYYFNLSQVSSPIPFMCEVLAVEPLCKPKARVYVEGGGRGKKEDGEGGESNEGRREWRRGRLSKVSSPIPFMSEVLAVEPLCKPKSRVYVEEGGGEV
jgi:hypothetical protein